MWKSGEEGLEDLFGFWESESDGEKSGSRKGSKDTSGSSETGRAEDKGERSSATFAENEAKTVYSGGIVDGQSETYYWNYPPSYEYEDEESDEEDYWNEINDWGRCGKRAERRVAKSPGEPGLDGLLLRITKVEKLRET